MPANASSIRPASAPLGANALATAPAGPGATPPSEPRMLDTPRVKSIRVLSASPNGVGSMLITRLPTATNGTVPATVTPASELTVRFWLPTSTLIALPTPLPGPTNNVISPTRNEPGSRVIVLLLPPSQMVEPPGAMAEPE